MANKVSFGLSQVHVAFQTENGFGAPQAITGAVSLSTDAAGDQTEVYADNIPWFVQFKNNGYTGTLEMMKIEDEILAPMIGSYIDANGGLVEDADGHPKKFALMAQIEGDEKARRFVMYSVEASRPGTNANTTESSITPNTKTLNITAVPYRFAGIDKNVVMYSLNEGDTGYSSFFSSVVLPASAATATYSTVTPEGNENPWDEGWYTQVDTGIYALTDDTTVDSQQTYYTKD